MFTFILMIYKNPNMLTKDITEQMATISLNNYLIIDRKNITFISVFIITVRADKHKI